MFGFLGYAFLFSYVTGSNSFPDILSVQDEEKYINALANGDEDAKHMLVVHNLRLVAHIAKKYNNNCKDAGGDLISIGTIGLIKGVGTYKPDKKVKLATYAAKCIENEILMHIRSSKKYANDISLQDIIGIDGDGNEIKVEDKIAMDDYDLEEVVNNQIQTQQLRGLVETTLKGREKTVIELRYGLMDGEEMTQREIADKLKISRSYVSRIEKKALQKLGREIL